jgi:hypothetical protein
VRHSFTSELNSNFVPQLLRPVPHVPGVGAENRCVLGGVR